MKLFSVLNAVNAKSLFQASDADLRSAAQRYRPGRSHDWGGAGRPAAGRSCPQRRARAHLLQKEGIPIAGQQ